MGANKENNLHYVTEVRSERLSGLFIGSSVSQQGGKAGAEWKQQS